MKLQAKMSDGDLDTIHAAMCEGYPTTSAPTRPVRIWKKICD